MPAQKNNEVIDLLRQISEKQDAQIEKINSIHTRQEVVQVKLENVERLAEKTNGRVTKLEAWRNYTLGIQASITALLGYLGLK